MGQVAITINGRSYDIACDDGQEDHFEDGHERRGKVEGGGGKGSRGSTTRRSEVEKTNH